MAYRVRARENLAENLNGSPQYLGTIAANATTTNHTTASPFNNTGDGLAGKMILIQTDAACYLRGVTTANGTVTSTNGVYIGTNERVIITLKSDEGWLAVLGDGGAANARVWELV
jgi:hypothetical protein